jgi:hypothetical protein
MGSYALSGTGSLTTAGDEYIGFNGTGTFAQSGGTNTLNGSSSLFLAAQSGSTGSYTLNSGSLIASNIHIGGNGLSSGGTGTFTFNSPATLNVSGSIFIYAGGTLAGNGTTSASVFNGGTIDPGSSPSTLAIGALTTQAEGKIQIDLAGTTPGTQYDQLHVTGALTLAGTLQVSLAGGFTPAAGNSFDVLDWGTLTGTFNTITLPALSSELAWNISQLYTTGVLSVTSVGVPGDYNNNGLVDAADYVVWRKNQGTTNPLPNDPIGGTIGSAQYDQWRSHFGQTAGSGAGVSTNATVPEPAMLVMLIMAALGVSTRRRWYGQRVSKLINMWH